MELSKEVRERIKADAESELLKMDRIIKEGVTEESRHHFLVGIQEGYVIGATAIAESIQPVIDALDQFISFHESGLLPAKHVYEKAIVARKQWKEGKEVEPEPEGCPYCGSQTCTSDHK